MSINPVAGIQLEVSPVPAENRSPGYQSPARPTPALGTVSNQDFSPSQNASGPAEIPEDEVEVQRENGDSSEIVIRYVDHSGRLILQVPSSEVLDVARGIDQNLAQAAKNLANVNGANAGGNGGKNHGH